MEHLLAITAAMNSNALSMNSQPESYISIPAGSSYSRECSVLVDMQAVQVSNFQH